MKCPSCSSDLPTNTTVRFCPFCGTDMDAVAAAAPVPAPAAGPEEKTQIGIARVAPDTIKDGEPVPEPDDQDKATMINMAAITQEEMAAVMNASEPEEEAELQLPTATGDDAGDGNFSETAWFMSAVSPEELLEAEGEALDYSEQDIMTDRYRRNEILPDAVRKDFSLSEDLEKKKSQARAKKRKK
ncbi:MAG: uncharacterized Zn finger protein (UPF0148 family) [Myxococcota bacterium]|jgi:uncharacterized Zn finger protein (UPF0148 family)